ncbi:hypothetical protein [Paenibacillus cremeus]|uniref:Uncharacterized protein n=1 Tax=Paenibacillus cremeus TaxID=2163881 RepID=A0A559KCQ7_9BACL|nr:hypothetical protein [Paenibacillus cremeus]TVY09904.1 hypothetical protein FPZ49_11070 [Paenibacillus cremeus]
MNYADMIKDYIARSPFSLQVLSNKLKKIGFQVDKAYLSKLQNGKVSPANNELNRAIAELTGNDPELLIRAAYMEKAPEEVKEELNKADLVTDLLTMIGDLSAIADKGKQHKDDLVKLKRLKMQYQLPIDIDETLYLNNPIELLMQLNHLLRFQKWKDTRKKQGIIIKTKFEEYLKEEETSIPQWFLNARSNSYSMTNLTSDERDYLEACLMTYRALKLKPMK